MQLVLVYVFVGGRLLLARSYTRAPKHFMCYFCDRANSAKFIERLDHTRLYFRSSGECRDEKVENLPSGELVLGAGGRERQVHKET